MEEEWCSGHSSSSGTDRSIHSEQKRESPCSRGHRDKVGEGKGEAEEQEQQQRGNNDCFLEQNCDIGVPGAQASISPSPGDGRTDGGSRACEPDRKTTRSDQPG